ncbi:MULTISPECIES: helix-turn-helix domain-containing protein [Thiorhodovibrio]|uniref:helix-turn-helix domain-containing protein n=1 Tax=Thiorhodovibrio TaxID=61593 RepID=UPI0019129D73|nr:MULTISPECIES: helix-turn-helix domain-containing protein [Thiorhodovibrio]MBK5967295.1 hypothetical protein [Thiorhodovibrio winogradskyi]WPL14453.1 transcriptional regulator EutR [Thiorhodovibrio litoralis]
MQNDTSAKDFGLACGYIETDDPIVFEATSRPWEVMSEPMGEQSFFNRKHYLATQSVVLYREQFSVTTRLRGMSPPGKLVVVVPLQLGEETRFFGHGPEPTAIRISEPGALDAIVDAEYAHFIILLDQEFLQRRLGEDAAHLSDAAVRRGGLLLGPEEFADFAAWLNRVLVTAGPRDRGRQNAGAGARQIVRKARLNPEKAARLSALLEEELPERLLDLCKTARKRLPPPRAGASRYRVVTQALEYLSEGSSLMPSVSELCEAAGAKQRTLEYAFEERFGLSPLRFVRVYRLHQARRELAAAAPGSTRVADVAFAQGFRHLSRFSQEYKRLFGEKPSQTLARRARAAAAAPLIYSSGAEAGRFVPGPSQVGASA